MRQKKAIYNEKETIMSFGALGEPTFGSANFRLCHSSDLGSKHIKHDGEYRSCSPLDAHGWIHIYKKAPRMISHCYHPSVLSILDLRFGRPDLLMSEKVSFLKAQHYTLWINARLTILTLQLSEQVSED